MVNKIKLWYNQGLWTAEMVKKAAELGSITLEDMERILKISDEEEDE